MDKVLGLLRLKVRRGVNLAVRDVRSSDPYVVLKMGKQKLKTRVVKKNVNPEWNEDLTFSVEDPILPIKLALRDDLDSKRGREKIEIRLQKTSKIVYDRDTFSFDDKMGDAEFDIKPFVEVVKKDMADLPSGTIITRIMPSRQNCLSEESCIIWANGKVVQDMSLRLMNVECGEVEIQLQWIDLPGSKGIQFAAST